MKKTVGPIAVALLLLTGCAGEFDNPEEYRAAKNHTCADTLTLLETTCGTVGCHSSMGGAAGVDLQSSDIVGRLAEQASSCGELVIIDSANPRASLLLNKLGATPTCGQTMPLGGTALTAVEIACIEDFLEDELR
ncbi:MAG: hypothetical protein JKY56_01110 [Kofleriaceae bacterium]|nr:hypothetical protein [Kofleriaceae bacterium]